MNESKDKRTGWLRDLKPGDQAASARGGLSSTLYTIYTVERITPGGKIVCLDGGRGTTFGPDGVGPRLGRWTPSERLQPYDDKLRTEMIRERLVSQAGRFLDFSRVSRDKLKELDVTSLSAIIEMFEPLKVERS